MFLNVTQELLFGFLTTLEIFALTLVFALPIGLVISLGTSANGESFGIFFM